MTLYADPRRLKPLRVSKPAQELFRVPPRLTFATPIAAPGPTAA